jgi:hypothetical protein
MANMVRYLPHLPSPKQRLILQYDCTEALFGGAAGGGKSDYLLMAAMQGVMVPNYSALLFRRTYQDLSLPGSLMDRSHQWWSGTDAHWDGEKKMWLFPTGARIGFGYLDGPRDHQRYQSAEFQFVGFDEASQFEERPALYLLSRLRAPLEFPSWLGCRWRGATNPGGIGHEWLQKRYQIPEEGTTDIIEQRANGKVVRAFVPSLAFDNPGLNVVEYLQKLDLLDPITRDQLRNGKWLIDSSGLVYYCYSDNCLVDSLPTWIPASEWQHVLSQDYAATTDATALAVNSYSPHEPEVYLSWTEEHHGMSPSDAARRTNELEEQFGGFVAMVGDSGGLGAGYMLEMQKHWAIPMMPAEKQHKLAFIKLMNGELANNRYKVVAPFCQTFISQAKTLLWKDATRTKENQSQPNHSTDAALYGWRQCRHYSTAERPEPRNTADPYELHLIDVAQQREWAERSEWG